MSSRCALAPTRERAISSGGFGTHYIHCCSTIARIISLVRVVSVAT